MHPTTLYLTFVIYTIYTTYIKILFFFFQISSHLNLCNKYFTYFTLNSYSNSSFFDKPFHLAVVALDIFQHQSLLTHDFPSCNMLLLDNSQSVQNYPHNYNKIWRAKKLLLRNFLKITTWMIPLYTDKVLMLRCKNYLGTLKKGKAKF